jgi:outer membrane protein assembly factor BamB
VGVGVGVTLPSAAGLGGGGAEDVAAGDGDGGGVDRVGPLVGGGAVVGGGAGVVDGVDGAEATVDGAADVPRAPVVVIGGLGPAGAVVLGTGGNCPVRVGAGTAVAGRGATRGGNGSGAVARDAVTGAGLWVHRSTGPSFIPQNATPSTAAIVDGTVYIGFPDGRVTALDRATGAVRWSRLLEGRPYLGGDASSPAVSGNTVFVGSNNGKLYSLDRATGEVRFTYDVGTWVSAGPAVSGNAVVAGAWDGNLYTFTGRAG